MDPQLKSILTSIALAASTSIAAWAVNKGLIPSADQSTIANDLVFVASGLATIVIAEWKRRNNTQTALITAVNNADNGVKVVPNTPATAAIPMAIAPLK